MFQLKINLQFFLSETEIPLSIYFWDVPWLQHFAYLADIFNMLKAFPLPVQGHSKTVLKAEDKMAAVELKLVSWTQRVKQNQFYCFYRTNEYFEE